MSSNCEFTSMYCPNVLDLSEDYIKNLFHDAGVGLVHRVDFFQREGKPYLSAMIHLDHWYETEKAYEVYENILAEFQYTSQMGSCFNLYFNKKGLSCYLTLCRMTTPYVEDTHKNVHQLAHDLAKSREMVEQMDITICQQVSKINRLEEMVQTLSTRLDGLVSKKDDDISRIHDTIYQLMGKVYDQNTESSHIYGDFNWMKYGKHFDKRWLLSPDDNGDEEGLPSAKIPNTYYTAAARWQAEEFDSDFEDDISDSDSEDDSHYAFSSKRVSFNRALSDTIYSLKVAGKWESRWDPELGVDQVEREFTQQAWKLFDETNPITEADYSKIIDKAMDKTGFCRWQREVV